MIVRDAALPHPTTLGTAPGSLPGFLSSSAGGRGAGPHEHDQTTTEGRGGQCEDGRAARRPQTHTIGRDGLAERGTHINDYIPANTTAIPAPY